MRDLRTLKRTTGAALCIDCAKCTTLCPLAGLEGFSAARMVAIHEPEMELVGHSLAVQSCLTCASCEVRCPQGVHFSEYVRGLRSEIPASALEPAPHGEVFSSMARLPEKAGNGGRAYWLEDGLRVAEEGETALFVGCLPLFDALFEEQLGLETVEIARSAIRLLNRCGIEPVLIGEERCCGHDLRWRGEEEAFRRVAEANTGSFKARGIKQILTTCAECCRTWRLDYPEVVPGYRPKVLHLAEFLADRIEKGELDFGSGEAGRLTYQDPCRLGRHLGVVEAPRRVLGAMPGVELEEMGKHGQDARCCGTPGFIRCDATSRRMQAQRLDVAAETGAELLVTSCPKCLIHFTCAQSEDRRRNRDRPAVRVQDLTVLAASMLEPAGASAPETTHQRGDAR